MTLVDLSVLLDVLTDGQVWADWSQAQLEQAAAVGPLVINDVIYAEISARYPSVDVVDFCHSRRWRRCRADTAVCAVSGG